MKENDLLKLVIPTIEYKEQVMECKKKFLENSEDFAGCAGLEDVDTYEEWIDFENRLSKKYGKDYVPSDVYLAIRKKDNKLIGIIDFRHNLSDFLFKYGGNIGYSIVLDERRKGYGKEMLRLMLEECKRFGKDRILITCDKENIASEKTIIANGGILENEVIDDVNIGKSGMIKRYWISLKKRFADNLNKSSRILDVKQKIKSADDECFTGDIYYYHIKKVTEKFVLPKGLCIMNDDYKWIEFYKYDSRIKLTVIYDEKDEVVEWYFDIARRIGKERGVPYEDDMYLDVVLTPKGEVILLDEDEYKDSFDRKEMTKSEYEGGYKIAYDLMEKLKGKEKQMKQFTDWIGYNNLDKKDKDML